MKKNLAKVLLAAGMFFSLSTSTTFAAEDNSENNSEPVEKINIPIEREEIDPSKYLVAGVVKDLTQKILPVSIEARFFAPHMELGARSDSIFFNGGEVKLKDTLGLGNDKAPEIIFRYKRFTADYLTVHGSGSRNFSGSNVLTFAGNHYHGNVDTDSRLHYLKLQVTNPVVSFLGAGVDWSYGLSGVYWKGTVSGREVGTGNSISRTKEFGAPIPTLGIGAHASLLDTLLFNVHLSGMPLGGRGHFYDFEAGLRYNPLDLLSISVGYRKIHANLKHGGDSGTLDLNGPYAGLRFDF